MLAMACCSQRAAFFTGAGGVPFYLIFMAMQYIPRLLEVKPLVTCSLGGALLAIHFRVLGPLPLLYAADIREVCLMPGAILYDVELLRFVTVKAVGIAEPTATAGDLIASKHKGQIELVASASTQMPPSETDLD